MDQAELTDRIVEMLEGLPGLGSAFLGGSHGRGEADAYSDVDVYVVVAEAADIPDVLARLAQSVGEISPVLYSKVLPNARTVNCITMDWLRFDLTVVSGIELAFLAGGQVKPLFDRLGLFEALSAAPAPAPQSSAEAFLDQRFPSAAKRLASSASGPSPHRLGPGPLRLQAAEHKRTYRSTDITESASTT